MKITDYKGHEMHLPESGGKAGKGCNKTSTIQVRKNNCIVKQFRFVMDNRESRLKAVAKARQFVDEQFMTAGEAKALAKYLNDRHPHRRSDADVMPQEI